MPYELVQSSATEAIVNDLMSRKPVKTDWKAVLRDVGEGKITSEQVLEKLKAMEPLPAIPGFGLDCEVWVLQQTLRLALRHEKGKPLTSKAICGCGRGFFDRVNETHHSIDTPCLYCEEETRQYRTGYSRNFQVAFDVVTRSWGLLICDGSSHDDGKIAFFAAVGWPTFEAVREEGFFPWALYRTWEWWGRSSLSGREGVPWWRLIEQFPNYPISPEEFRQFTREQLLRKVEAHTMRWI